MKIVYLSDVDISLVNGPGVNEREFVWTIQTQSELRGDEAFFIIPKPSKKLDFTLKNVDYYRTKFLKKLSLARLNVLLPTLLTAWHLSKPILKKVKNSNIDLFVIRLSQPLTFLLLALSILRQKYAIKTLGNIYGFHKESFTRKSRIYHYFTRTILGRILKKAIFVDVCTQQFYENYKNKYFLKNIEVIDNSVNVNRFYIMDKALCKKRCGLQHLDKIVGYFGGYPSSRGAQQLVEISPRLIMKYPRCGVLIIGEDSELNSLKEKAKQLVSNRNIIFKGLIDYEELPYYVNCMDVSIALDMNEIIDSVGNSSQKIRQSIACGVPIVCPKKTNESIINEGLGLAVTPNNLDEILRAMSFWLDKSEEEFVNFRKRAYEFAKNYLSTEVAYEKRYNFWKKLLKN